MPKKKANRPTKSSTKKAKKATAKQGQTRPAKAKVVKKRVAKASSKKSAKKSTTSKRPTQGTTRNSKIDVGVPYDDIHLSGDEDAIFEYECEHFDSGFITDWRGDIGELLEDVNSRLSDREIFFDEPAKAYQAAVCCGERRINLRSFDRVEILRAMDKVTRGGSEEIRLHPSSLVSDTLYVVIKPVSWWRAMDKQFPKQMKAAFVRLRDVTDS